MSGVIVRVVCTTDWRVKIQVFVEFSEIHEAAKARTMLNGRKFGGNSVVAVYYPEESFARGDFGG